MSAPVARRVWTASGGRCAFCNKNVLDDDATGRPVFTGELAHIVGATSGAKSPRGESRLSLKERAEADNLLLLCGDEHKVIDSDEFWDRYSDEDLRHQKAWHEQAIRDLTSLRSRPRTAVVRVVGDIRGRVTDFSRDTVVTALFAQGRFPDFPLQRSGPDGFEIDLRGQLAGAEAANDAAYLQFATTQLRERLAPLRQHLTHHGLEHLSVFALARIPLLVLLGTLLDDGTRVTVQNKRRDSDIGWGWPSSDPSDGLTVAVTVTQGSGDPVVAVSVSGPVNLQALPPELEDRPRYELTLTGVPPSPTALRSAADLEILIETWRGLLAMLERDYRGRPVNLLAAVPAAAAVELGRAHMNGTHPMLRVYDWNADAGTYIFALEAGQ
ncbi:MAG: SAVED domain-containing protein [Kineosporiaceae bacterium]